MDDRNIRFEQDRLALIAEGWSWVTVCPRGDRKGSILSRHRTYEAANEAARGKDRAIVETAAGDSF